MYKKLSSFMQRAAVSGGKGRQATRVKVPDILKKAFSENKLVNGYVTKRIKGGYAVLIDGFEAFCPNSKMKVGVAGEEKTDWIGEYFRFKVLEVRVYSAVVSRIGAEKMMAKDGSVEIISSRPVTRYPPILIPGPGHIKVRRKRKG